MAVMTAVAARAHEVFPSIADLTVAEGRVVLTVETTLESILAGIDLSAVVDTNAAAQAAEYDRLRSLPPQEIETAFRALWPTFGERITLRADGAALVPELVSVSVPEEPDLTLVRSSVIVVSAALPAGAAAVEVGWDAALGQIVVRQQGVEEPYDGLLSGGQISPPINLAGGNALNGWQTFVSYIPVGIDHIVPKGLDHILFVLGLFFLSTRMGPLLWQVSAFTLAHTITLALAALDIVRIPGEIVEPLIAASIVYVAVENILSKGLTPWRPVIVFGFGLLHGLGFASVLAEFGLPDNAFVPALIGFNVGVELGQLIVIGVAFLAVGLWFGKKDWYKARIANPASAAIAVVGAWWVVERVFL